MDERPARLPHRTGWTGAGLGLDRLPHQLRPGRPVGVRDGVGPDRTGRTGCARPARDDVGQDPGLGRWRAGPPGTGGSVGRGRPDGDPGVGPDGGGEPPRRAGAHRPPARVLVLRASALRTGSAQWPLWIAPPVSTARTAPGPAIARPG